MALRPSPRRASRDPHYGPWTTCDRCGLINSHSRMQFQFDFYGGASPQNSGLLVCSTCLDDLSWEQKLIVLPPDPQPFFNTRPEPYTIDESNWLTTEDGDVIDTEGGDKITPSIPSPEEVAGTTFLSAGLTYLGGSVGTAYLDLFSGDPTSGGTSILSIVTGSATRTNIASYLATANGTATNTTVIPVTTASDGTSTVTHIGLYSAATAGTLLVSGAVGATYPTIAEGTAVSFDALALTIRLA